MKVYWTDSAKIHLRSIYNYIKQDSERYALATVDRITERTKQIAEFPYSGKKVPEYESDEIREIIEPPYRVIYRVYNEQIQILAIVHGRMNIEVENDG